MSSRPMPAAPEPQLVSETNISRAYAQILLHVMSQPGREIAPLYVSITGFAEGHAPVEHAGLRIAMDDLLRSKDKRDVDDVAFTIFPQRYWHMARGDRSALFRYYRMAFPAFRAANRQVNGRGLYFERLTMFGDGPCDGNQLEYVLSQYNSRSGVRRSMLQAAIFDPGRDHTPTAQLGFPCLQQVSFVPGDAGLVMNAFYATQQLFDKAYGNYLGLAQLGAFMASEMQLPFARLNVMVGIAKLERISKSDPGLLALAVEARECLAVPATRGFRSTGAVLQTLAK